MSTREERIRIGILGSAEGARDVDRLARATDHLGGEFKELARDAGKLDQKLDDLKVSQRELAGEFARTGNADIGKQLQAANAEASRVVAARKALVGDLESTLDEADRAAAKRARDDDSRQKAALKVAEAHAKAAEARATADRKRLADLGNRVTAVGRRAGLATLSVAHFGATVSAVASLAGPAVSGLLGIAKGVAATGRALAAIGPAAAVLPGIGASVLLISGTIKSAAPAIAKAVSPIGDAFKRTQDHVGALASKGLPALSQGFVKVNFPAISKAMDAIATSTDHVLVNTGKWVNSTSGQQAIRQITEATADATKRLEGPISRVVVSFGELVKRAGGGAIRGLADSMGKLADKTAAWLDTISGDDIKNAQHDLAGWGAKVKETFLALRDVGKWMADNEDKVKHFSDVLAGSAIAIGLATGNMGAVIGGSVSLAINHWDDLKKTFSGDSPIKAAFDKIKNDSNLQGIWDSMKAAWHGFVDSFKKETADIAPKFKEMTEALKKAWDEWGPIIKAWWDGVGKPTLSALGTIFGWIAVQAVDGLTKAADFMTGVGIAGKALWLALSDVFGKIINGAAWAFGWVPGLGDKLKKAADDFNGFRDRVNNALAGIKDVDVNIRYHEIGRAVAISSAYQSGIGGRASGGSIAAGTPYMVGERGPELITPTRNGWVNDAASTRQMLSGSSAGGAAGGTQRITFDFTGVPTTDNGWVPGLLNALRTGDLKLKVAGTRVVAG